MYKLTNEELREKIYTDLIQEYDHLSHEKITDMVDTEMRGIMREREMSYEDQANLAFAMKFLT